MIRVFLNNKNLHICSVMMFIQTFAFAQTKTEFSSDKTEFYKTHTENVNGCLKVTSWKCFDAKTKQINEEWYKRFSKDRNQTCDFSSYMIIRKKYGNGKLLEVTRHYAASEQSEEQACGIWKYFTKNRKLSKTKNYGTCKI